LILTGRAQRENPEQLTGGAGQPTELHISLLFLSAMSLLMIVEARIHSVSSPTNNEWS